MHLRSAAVTGERVVGGRTAGLLELGEEVTWRARHLGLWHTLSSRITALRRPEHFRDALVRGPLARLEHDHFFSVEEGEVTVMRDVFEFAAPGGPLGRVAEALFLTAHFRRFLMARNQELKAVAESDEWRQFLPATPRSPSV